MKNIFIVKSDDIDSINIGKCISEYCKINKIDNNIFYSNNTSEISEIAKIHSIPGNIIHCIGDNSLIKATMNGMVYSNAYLSIIPINEKNDFLDYIKNYNKYYLDICKVNEILFTDSVTIGLHELPKYNSNGCIYKLKLLLCINKIDSIDIVLDNYHKELSYLLVCSNQHNLKKSNEISKYNDSFFNVYEIGKTDKLTLLKIISKLLKKESISHNKILYYKCDELSVTSEIQLSCSIDGEKIIGNDFRFSLYPEAILLDIDDRIKIKKYLRDKNMIK